MTTLTKHTIYYEGSIKAFKYSVQYMTSDPERRFTSPDMLRVVYIRSGHCTWVISGRPYYVKEGDIILLNNTEQRMQTGISESNPVCQEVIRFAPIAFDDCADCLPIFFSRTASFSNVFTGSYPGREKIVQIIDNIRDEAEKTDGHTDIILTSLMRLLLVQISRAGFALGMTEQRKQPFTGSARNFQILCDSINYIKANLTEDLSARQLAERAGVSRCYFSRLFKTLMGITIPQYIRVLRLNNVQRLITEKQYNILEAVYACGFGSASSYYKALHCLTDPRPDVQTISDDDNEDDDEDGCQPPAEEISSS